MKLGLTDQRIESSKLHVYQRVCALGFLITSLALFIAYKMQAPYDLEILMTVITSMFCIASFLLFWRFGILYLSWFEWFAILIVSIFFIFEFWRATVMQSDWFNLNSSIFVWMPLVYIFTSLVLPNKLALWLSLAFFATILLIGVIAIFVNWQSAIWPPDFLLLIQIYGSNLIYITLLHSIALLRDRYGEAERRSERMMALAMVDDMTGLSNRRKLDQLLDLFVEQAHTRLRPFSVVMLDVDNFKQINDEFGHDCGDDVLRRVAEILCSNLRESDQVGRWGGDEFLVCSPDTNDKQVQLLCRRLSESVARSRFPNVARVTISFGAATLLPQESATDLWKRADTILLHSKREKTLKVSERGL